MSLKLCRVLKVKIRFAQQIKDHWIEKYDWKRFEKAMNGFGSHHRLSLADKANGPLRIHFVKIKAAQRTQDKGSSLYSKTPQALLFLHGWPARILLLSSWPFLTHDQGSFWECHKIAPMISNPTAHGLPASVEMDVICPSLPGYGFSDKPRVKGMGPKQIAKLMASLMAELGYTSYFVQGGDWGSFVATYLAAEDPKHCKAVHLNLNIFSPAPTLSFTSLWEGLKLAIAPKWFFSESELGGIQRCYKYFACAFFLFELWLASLMINYFSPKCLFFNALNYTTDFGICFTGFSTRIGHSYH